MDAAGFRALHLPANPAQGAGIAGFAYTPGIVTALERVRAVLGRSIEVKQQLLESCASEIAEAAERVAATFARGGKVLLFGNGGSAADAQHIAAEWVGRYVGERRALPATALNANPSELTAVANDYGYDRVFVRGVEAHGRDGDVAIAVGSDAQWGKLVAALDLKAPEDADWATNPGRVTDRARVEASVATAVKHLSRAEVEARLAGVPCAPVNRVLEALEDPQAKATGARIETDGVPHVASPHRFHA